MQFNSAFNIGDKGWTFDGAHVRQRTIGQIKVIHTESNGIGDGFMEGGVASYSGNSDGVPDNYAPIPPATVEEYMCVETGIGSGSVYTLGKHIFVSEEECRVACAEAIERRAAEVASRKAYEREQKLKQEATLRWQLAEIERLKAKE